MDLQSLLICPHLEASVIYYEMKLSCHNFTLFDLATNRANNYFWDEGEGDLNANVFASCVIDYLDAIPDKSNVKTVIIYSVAAHTRIEIVWQTHFFCGRLKTTLQFIRNI